VGVGSLGFFGVLGLANPEQPAEEAGFLYRLFFSSLSTDGVGMRAVGMSRIRGTYQGRKLIRDRRVMSGWVWKEGCFGR